MSALDVFLGLVRDTGSRIGDEITPAQLADARVVLDPESSTPYAWLGRARGYSKTDDAAGLVLAAMLTQLGERARAFGFAADRDQAQLLADSAAGFVERTSEITGAFDVDAWKVTARSSGASLSIMAADAASTWGLRPALVVCDEVANWPQTGGPRRVWQAITSAMGKVPGSRLVAITSAGDPATWQGKLHEHALEDPLWYVHDIAGPPPWAPAERLDEQRRQLPESAYRQLFLNEWCQSEDAMLDADDVAACVGHEHPLDPAPGTKYVLTVDLGWRHDRTALCVAHRERDGDAWRIVADRVDTIAGSRDREVDLSGVEERVIELARRYNAARVWCDPAQAIGLMQRVRRAQLRVSEHVFSASSNTQLALRLLELVRAHRLVIPDNEDLVDELCNLRIVERGPGLFKLDTLPGRHDDMAVVLGMAAVHLLAAPAPAPDVAPPSMRAGSYWSGGGGSSLGQSIGRVR